MTEERTEKATSRRLLEARRKGQIARSRDVEQAAQLLAVLVVLGWWGRTYVDQLGRAVRLGLERMGQLPGRTIEPGEVTSLAVQGALTLAVTAGPIAVAAASATLLAATAQGGWNVATEALKPNWVRLSPAAGLRRLALPHAGFDLLKMLAALAVLTWVGVGMVTATLQTAAGLGRVDPVQAALVGWGQAERLLRYAALALGVLAGGDYLLQRWRLARSLRMTKKEVRDDLRLTEGSPEVKGRIRRMQQDLVRRRMLAAVSGATVVITNPTHYAVALLYERPRMAAPQVVAKGRNLLAARIREIAREHGVPIMENVPLAQALYRGTEVGETIPPDLFGAVAEVLAYLIRLKQLVL
jgi:flagellar biosynthetic protein FlhB